MMPVAVGLWRRLTRTGAAVARVGMGALVLICTALPSAVRAQTILLEGPPTAILPSITPAFQLLAIGLGPARPLEVRLQISTTPDFVGLVLDSVFSKTDTSFSIQVTRPLPSNEQVYWRARVRALAGLSYESVITGPRRVPDWLALIAPTSMEGNIRRPLFIWRSAPVTAATGPWRYDVEIATTREGLVEVAASGLTDTTFRPPLDLQANRSYKWSVRAYLRGGESVQEQSAISFVIRDPPLPTTTILYQNFPNPFPSPTSFNTCFWFDIGEGGARVRLDVLDLRGTQIRRIVPASDGIQDFPAGRYGRGPIGGDTNCDNRFIWDGLAEDGRTVAPGVYLVRFQTGTSAPIFRRIVFKGR
ncbi:MAG: hypothetical protein IBJ03_04125 [Gemmatimonadaceae bacterium]|nr:hypothetical protein [Gemmatimonadaceae bacterium]